jgi:hypothetical protein
MCPLKTALAPTKCTCLRHKYVPIQDSTCTYQAYMLETQVCTHSMVHLPLPNVCVLKASDLGRQWSPTSAKETQKVSPPVPCMCAGYHMSPNQQASSSMPLGGTASLATPEPAPKPPLLKLYTLTNAPSLPIKAMCSVSPTSPCPATIIQYLKHIF